LSKLSIHREMNGFVCAIIGLSLLGLGIADARDYQRSGFCALDSVCTKVVHQGDWFGCSTQRESFPSEQGLTADQCHILCEAEVGCFAFAYNEHHFLCHLSVHDEVLDHPHVPAPKCKRWIVNSEWTTYFLNGNHAGEHVPTPEEEQQAEDELSRIPAQELPVEPIVVPEEPPEAIDPALAELLEVDVGEEL
jgi:hypothetical protein